MKKEGREGEEALELEEEAVERVPVRIEGLRNLWYLALIIVAVVLNGAIPQTRECLDPATGLVWGVDVCEGVHLGFNYFLQIGLIGLAAILSLATTPRALREKNDFEWGAHRRGGEAVHRHLRHHDTGACAPARLRGRAGHRHAPEFFWATGALSSFLDNSPTYVVFLTAAGSLGAGGATAVATTVGAVASNVLLAISAGPCSWEHDLHRQRPQLHGEVHSRAFRREDAQLLRVHGVVAGHFCAPLRAGHGAVLPVRGVPWEGSADGDVRVAA